MRLASAVVTGQEWDDQQVRKLLMKAARWSAQTSAGAGVEVEAKSPLCGDNKRSHPYELSQAAWLSIFYAVDQVNTARLVVVEAKMIPSVGLFTLLRGALETASRAVYLLAPIQRPERLLRRVCMEAAEIRNAAEAEKLTRQPISTQQQEPDQRVRELAQRMGLPDGQTLSPASPGNIVKMAGQESPVGERRSTLVWRMCSAYAHGERWPILAASELTDQPGAPEGTRYLQVKAGTPALLLAVWTATQMIEQAWWLYDLRRRSPYGMEG